jgi:RNA-directed DNA polymerase
MQTSRAQILLVDEYFNTMSNTKITWNSINWTKTQNNVRKIQRRIYMAKKNGEIKKLRWLQKFIINHMGAKLLAVRQVTTLNKGKNTIKRSLPLRKKS